MYMVEPLSEAKLSRVLRSRLRAVAKRHGTGLLMQGIIRTPTRSMSSKNPSVAIRKGETWLCMASSSMLFPRFPKWVTLVPGEHDLAFHAFRSKSHSSFSKRFALAESDVLVAICEPIQPWTIFGKSPTADHWWIGVISQSSGNPPPR